jgi:NAD(P)-dependent dehydrogenase (short-subunit alcohol dehydrogenase family)
MSRSRCPGPEIPAVIATKLSDASAFSETITQITVAELHQQRNGKRDETMNKSAGIAISAVVIFFLIAAMLPGARRAMQAEVQAAESKEIKAVLVTGASTGLGRATTELLASSGYFVYAGARKDKDLADLNAIPNVQSVRLDVTSRADIDAAVELITDAGRGLHGLVNNAGVGVIWPLIEIDEDDFDFQMQVNLYGPYRISKAFSPLIIEAKGRITNISSVSGIFSAPLFGPYSMSKHALEAFTDALAGELSRFGVQVSAIEPGAYTSKIGENWISRMKERGIGPEGSIYKDDLEQMLEWSAVNTASFGDPVDVAEAVMHALFDENPKRRYLVVPDQSQAEFAIRAAIERLVQLNDRHAFSYDRDSLVSMLDDRLAVNE